MIGFNQLGNKGWLGNQMFQYAGLQGIAANRNLECCIPPDDGTQQHNYGLWDCFKLTNLKTTGYVDGPMYQSPTAYGDNSCSFKFCEYTYNNCPDNVNLNAFFQTEKYFAAIADQIRQDFEFQDSIKQSCVVYMHKFDNPIFLHVRRSDYVKRQEFHSVQTPEYYRQALDMWPADQQVIIFSDDMEWCRQQKLFQHERFTFSNSNKRFDHIIDDPIYNNQPALVPFWDLCKMSMCKGGIMANSSLSWWAAWLQNHADKQIVAPSNWFGPELWHLDTSDVYCKDWIKI